MPRYRNPRSACLLTARPTTGGTPAGHDRLGHRGSMKASHMPKHPAPAPSDQCPINQCPPSAARMSYYGYRYCAPSEAWRLLRGESPRRTCPEGESPEGQELAPRFVSSLAGVKEGGNKTSTTERHNRSVDRESRRPQGRGTSPKQSSLVTSSCGGRRCNSGGSQQQGCAIGECPVTPPGSKSVACGKRDARNLGDPQSSRPQKVAPYAEPGRESRQEGG